MTSADLLARLRGVLRRGWVEIPDEPGFGGTGAPAKVLAGLIGLDDASGWAVKWHSRRTSVPLTLFHLEGRPRGHMRHMVAVFGWEDHKGRRSFRHTVWGRSDLGFYVANESSLITVRHPDQADIVWPHWTHEQLGEAFTSRYRRLIVVQGEKQSGRVRYQVAHLFGDPQVERFIEAIEHGRVAIDFDARTLNGRGLRNHGTKFRVRFEDLRRLYGRRQRIAGSARP